MHVWSANQISCSVGLVPVESGRGDDEFIRIEQQEDNFTYKAGVDGEGTRSENKNRYTVVTITLMATSSGNAVLSALHTGDITIDGGAGIVPIAIRDRAGLDVFMAPEAWVIKPPDVANAKEVGTREWKIGVHNPTRFDGGH